MQELLADLSVDQPSFYSQANQLLFRQLIQQRAFLIHRQFYLPVPDKILDRDSF